MGQELPNPAIALIGLRALGDESGDHESGNHESGRFVATERPT